MKYKELRKIRKLYFGYEEIAKALGISSRSARVSATRYIKQGVLVRAKKNMYVLREKWDTLEKEEGFILANLIQVPSYISLVTALEYYEITTQVQRNFIESIAIKRTKVVDVGNIVFKYSKIYNGLYFGFSRKRGIFIADPEKAFLDAVYLMSFGRYGLDFTAIDFDKLDLSKLRKIAKKYPKKTQKFLEGNECFKKT